MTLGDILKRYRMDNNISIDEFSKKSSLSKGYISMLENNINPRNNKPIAPTLPTIQKIAVGMGTDVDTLLKAIDSNQNISLKDETESSYDNDNSLNFKIEYEEIEHIKKYRNLDEQGRLHVNTVLDWETERVKKLSRQQKQNTKAAKETPQLRIIQYYQRLASAGKGEYLFDDIPADTIKVKDTPISCKADFAIGVSGNSMEPDYYDGEKVFVEKTAHLEIGEVGIFVQGENCYIKELGKDRLVSRNRKCLDVIPTENVRIVGKVLGKVEEYYG